MKNTKLIENLKHTYDTTLIVKKKTLTFTLFDAVLI